MTRKKNRLPILVSVQKIWDQAAHNSMTDLIRFKDLWILAFREGENHMGTPGSIRLLVSHDGFTWVSLALFSENRIDLRDPKLSVMPDGKLMLLCGSTIWGDDQEYISMQSRVSFSSDGRNWTPFQTILQHHQWLWKAAWLKEKAYGIAYRFSDPMDRSQEWLADLYVSPNGIDWKLLSSFAIEGYPSEGSLCFTSNGDMVALLRRYRRVNGEALIGISQPPYQDWNWKNSGYQLGGPNFIITPDDCMWAGGRILTRTPYGLFEKTIFAEMSFENVTPRIYLPSGGDSGYPGMVYYDGLVWMSYYSSHEDKTAIYLARIAI